MHDQPLLSHFAVSLGWGGEIVEVGGIEQPLWLTQTPVTPCDVLTEDNLNEWEEGADAWPNQDIE